MSDSVTLPRSTLRKRTRRSFGKIKKLPSGRYQASYLGPDGERHNGPVTFLAKQHADQWLAMRQSEIRAELEAARPTRGGRDPIVG